MADSRFCRDCGAPIAAPAPRAMNEDDRKMIHDAQRLFGEGRYDEAAMLATAILEDIPNCIQALAVKGDCHEHMGEYRAALDSYRTILSLEPESQLDLIRVARLEKLVASGDIVIAAPDTKRRTAIGAAIAAAMLLVSSGSALIIATQGVGAEQTLPINGSNVLSEPFLPVSPVPDAYGAYRPNAQDGPQDQGTAGIDDAARTLGDISPIVRGGDQSGIAPGALSGAQRSLNEPNVPVTIPPDRIPQGARGGDSAPGIAPNTVGNRDPDPPVVDDGEGTNGNRRNTVVDVRPSKDSGTAANNMTATERAARIDTLIRVARDQYVQGNYDKAADAYEKALVAGASPASTNQRLAQCNEKLGRKADAIKAYERAIQALEQLDQNDSRVQTQIDACRSALKLIRGN